MSSKIFSSRELRRYKKHIMMPEIGINGQAKLKKAKVAVVGAGGLGAPVLLYLAAAGVGTLRIIDCDLIEESNLQRQVLYGYMDLGKHKTVVARRKLSEVNPDIHIEIVNSRIDQNNGFRLVEDMDIVVDCTDNFATRFLINDLCVIANKPMVHGAVFRTEGQVSVFNYHSGPSYRCLYPDSFTDDKLTDPSNSGLLNVLPGTVGTIQANEVIKIITGIGKILSGKMLFIDMMDYNNYLVGIKRNERNFLITELMDEY